VLKFITKYKLFPQNGSYAHIVTFITFTPYVKKTLFIIALLLIANLNGQVERDKALHFLGGNLYGLAGAGIAKQLSDGDRYWTFAGAVGGSLMIGLAKEAVDAGQRENGWDNEDLLATVLGGMTVGLTIELFTNKKRQKRRNSLGFTDVGGNLPADPLLLTVFDTVDGLPTLAELGLSTQVRKGLQ